MSEPVEVEVAGEVLPYEELRRRRGCVRIPNELLLQMTDRAGDGWAVLGVHADWERQAVMLMVAHPDLREVAEGTMAPDLDQAVSLWRDLQVIDGQVYARSELRIEDPQVAASRDRREVREQLQAIVESYGAADALDTLLERLIEEARARRPVSADAFLESLR